MSLDGHVLPEGEVRSVVLGSLPIGLAFLWTVDPDETDAYRAVVVLDFEGVAVEDGDDGAGEVPREYGWAGANEEASRGYSENQQSASTGASNQHPIDSENDARCLLL